MYSDLMINHRATASRQEPRSPGTPDTELSSPNSRRGVHRYPKPKKAYILFLGPSGSGKSLLINTVSNEKFPVASHGMGLCTTEFRYANQVIAGQSFRLIDSPGLNTNTRSNYEIFKQLITYLVGIRSSMDASLAGVFYLHPQDCDLGSEQLKKNIGAIKHLFGEAWLPYITVAIVGGDTPDPHAIRLLQDPTSPFYSLHAGGSKIRHLEFETIVVEGALLECDKQPPPEPAFYSKLKINWKWGKIGRDGLDKLMDEVLGPQQSGPTNRVERRLPRLTLEESESSRQQLQLALTEAEVELKSLRAQLEQTRLEYGSLRSELQLHDNTEQNRLVQSLKDLNRSIEDFSRLASQQLFDNYIVPFAEDVDNLTALHARNLSELQVQFEHKEGISSLIASSSGAGMTIEDFIDLALRSIICRRLYEGIFLPFHPMLTGTPEATFMTSLYNGVRHHAPQNVAANWRANSFVALSREKGSEAQEEMVETHTETIMKSDILKLIDNFFGQDKGAVLTEQQHGQLKEIITSAWKWNDILKGDVVTHGDFQPTFYEPGLPFDAQNMLEFEPEKGRESLPEFAICTIGLGLSLSHSKAKGDKSGPLVVCKATVITERFYTRS